MSTTHRILVVANRTCSCPALQDEARDRAGAHEEAEVLIVSPALNSSRLAHWVSDTDKSVMEAEARLAETVESLRLSGVAADG